MLLRLEDQPDVRLSVIFIASSPTSWVPDGASVPLALQFEAYTIQEMTSIINRLLPVDKTREEMTKTFINSEHLGSKISPPLDALRCDQNCYELYMRRFYSRDMSGLPHGEILAASRG